MEKSGHNKFWNLKASFLSYGFCKYNFLSTWNTKELMHCHCGTTVDIHGPLQTRGVTRCPGGVSVSCLASRTRHECPRNNESVLYGGFTLAVDRHYIGSVTATTHQIKGIITIESNPSRGNCTTSSTRQREKQHRSTEDSGVFKTQKVRRHNKFRERMVSTLEQMQVPNGTGPGVRRSKASSVGWPHPLQCSMETSRNLVNKVKIVNKVQFGNRFLVLYLINWGCHCRWLCPIM